MVQDDARSETPMAGASVPTGTLVWRRWLRLVIGAGLVVAVLAGVMYWLNARQYETTDDAFIDTTIVRIAPQVAGVVDRVAVSPNQHVGPGDPLVTINPDTTSALLMQQEAGLAEGAAEARQAAAQITMSRGAVVQAEAQQRIEQQNASKAQRDWERLRAAQRLDPAAVAGGDLDAARTAFEAASQRAVAAAAATRAARAQLDATRNASGAASAQERAAQARVAQARLTVGQNRIIAPLAGHITAISVNKGSYVGPGTQMMALVPDDLWITANFKETQLAAIRPGQQVEISIDAYPGVNFTGRVASIQRGAGQAFQLFPPQNATGNFVKVVQRVPVRIVFDKLDLQRYPLGPGMSVQPRIKVR